MQIVILSGGSSKRLWPHSNNDNAKQFIKSFKYNDKFESLIQRIYRQINNKNILISTNKYQEEIIKKQLGNVKICIEPSRRNTYGAILLSSLYLKDKLKVNSHETIIFVPSDSYVDDDFFKNLNELDKIIQSNKSNIALLGITPKILNTKYGYIVLENDKNISKVSKFIEKPNIDQAKELILNNALYNCGIFAFKLKYILDKSNYLSFDELYNDYDNIENISFDYKILEKEKDISVIRVNSLWNDLGTWDSFLEYSDNDDKFNYIDKSCNNVKVLNELNIKTVLVDVKDIILILNKEGILLMNNNSSNKVKDIIEDINT